MARLDPLRRKANGRYGALKRHHGDDDPRTIEAKTDAGIAAIADHVRKVVDGLPPLTPEQKAELAALLWAPGDS